MVIGQCRARGVAICFKLLDDAAWRARYGQNERGTALGRKNWLFAGSEGGGRTCATLATLLQTAKMNKADSLDWLSQTLTRIAQRWPASEIGALMPWNFKTNGIN